MLSDGVVSDQELGYLRDWMGNHPDACRCWPLNVIAPRLAKAFEDGRIEEDERADLHNVLAALVGGKECLLLGYEGATELPLDTPPPLMSYGPDEVYVFTGRFAYGTRATCEREVAARGSACESNVTRRMSFMIVGTFGSRDWVQTSYGRKIQRAVELRNSGFAVRIVGEDHWAGTLHLSE
jgi:hypothetical protein